MEKDQLFRLAAFKLRGLASGPKPKHLSRLRDVRVAGPRSSGGALRFGISALPLRTARFATWSTPMTPTKRVVAEAEIDRRCEAARKAGDLAGMQRAMAELPAVHHAYFGTAEINRR
jgi:hypothetical protein